MTPEQVDALYVAIQTRPRPEDVAELVLGVLGPTLSDNERQPLDVAARHALRRTAQAYTSMAQDFARPVSNLRRQVAVAATLFDAAPVSLTDGLDAVRVRAYVGTIGSAIQKLVGRNDFRTDRLATKRARRAAGIYKSARWYNKRWRLLAAIEDKLDRLAWNQRRYKYTRVGKSALASTLTRADVAADRNTACFIAYLSARMSLRSVFTNTSQTRAFDSISQMLMTRCEGSRTTRWDLIARLLPDGPVLRRLADEEKGQLLGQWWNLLAGMGDMLETVWRQTEFNLATMIVARGQDSSTWNQVAGGWNIARGHWLALLHALGTSALLEAVCPGKVMRLMAADVARWHQASGGDVHPDTQVWALLPPPWQVLRGDATCTRTDVETACVQAGLPPAAWTGVKGPRVAVAYTPTPELVHGVTVSSPTLAAILRKAGVFSGRPLKGPMPDGFVVERDASGAALAAHEGSAVAQDESSRL